MKYCRRETRARTAKYCLATFVVAAGVAIVNELVFGILFVWNDAHTLSHYLFGLGFPLSWASIFVAPRAEKLHPWQLRLARRCDRHYRKGFLIGAAITGLWSTWNELIVYLVRNPAHPLDWHHWLADFAGIITAFLIYKRLLKTGIAMSFRPNFEPART